MSEMDAPKKMEGFGPMRHKARWTLAVVALVAVAVGACSPSSSGGADKEEAVTVEKDQSTGLSRLALSPKAAGRLGIATTAVAAEATAANLTVVPYAAVVYDAQGKTWTYTNARELVFVRHEITVDRIDGDRAILSSGPPVGTAVVTVGAAELWGVETGVGGGH